MQHSFDTDIAQEYGILEAVILNHIDFWIAKNKANDVHFHDGCYWTYNSVKAFGDLFPYASQKQIRGALNRLIEEGLLQTGNFNDSAYDRTLWYAFTEKGEQVVHKRQMQFPCRENEFAPEGEPIPDIDTDIDSMNIDTKDIYNPPYIIPPKENEQPKQKKDKKKSCLSIDTMKEEIAKRSFSSAIVSELYDWIEYKGQIKCQYTSVIGFNRVLTELENAIKKHGEKAVIERIDESMSREWQGWYFDTVDAFDKNRTYVQHKAQTQQLDKRPKYKEIPKSKDTATYAEQQKKFQDEALEFLKEKGYDLDKLRS